MKKRIILLSLIVAQLVVGCSSFYGDESSAVAVHFSEPNRIQFQGKGAGAGFALMSTMGPVGIALGVAIDVGIAKDIQEPARVSGFDMNSYISQSIETQSQAAWKAVFLGEASRDLTAEFPNIEIKRYGFKTTGGANDATSAELVILVKVSQAEQFEYHYLNDFIATDENSQRDVIPSYPLADLKSDGALSVLLMKQAVDSVMAKVVDRHLNL
ncbi:hypothetical protein FM037_24535 [Shewanella psychropiezotolerans]|uniref:Lipoprotein n=1 Tax=Shewanella psychropiezotolerans TaxID=2593655 RepID=A0ABX5X4F9_9GAMM|nr:hypothetical protein [Shewanella psychropiezotolerans]QDO85848.1 hypothetical protein FM037_24535 [Shewanella psychropiezotolerans]